MGKSALTILEIRNIKELRETGHSLIEIKNVLNRGYGTIFKYIKNVSILPEYKELWQAKRGGSKAKSIREWKLAEEKAKTIINKFEFKERMLVLSCLYWGEGNKKELSLINSDPTLVKVFYVCLKDLGVPIKEFKISLRLFEEIDIKKAIDFWTRTLGLPEGSIAKLDIIKGEKKGKLEYGMCRIRVKKSGKYFKLIMSMIDLIRVGI